MSPSPRVRSTLLAFALLAFGSALGCQRTSRSPAPAPKTVTPTPAATPSAAIPAPPGAPASVSGQSAPDCVGPFTESGPATEVKVDGRTFRQQGATLTLTEPDQSREIVFGVLANLMEPTGENLFNDQRYLKFFADAKAQAILVAGDTGDSREETMGTVEPLAKSGLPVLVIPGNHEGRTAFRSALDALHAKYPNVVDMTRIRLVRFGAASVVSLPGYYDARFLNQGPAGCQYFKEDVSALAPIIAAATQPVVLLSHAEPYGHGHEAIDAFKDGNAGDWNLTAFLRTHPVPFGVAANILEAGGRATDLDSNLIREGAFVPRLYLNPGEADSTAWNLNDGTTSHGMVATLTIHGSLAAYQTFRVAQLSMAEEAEAGKLAPTAAPPPVTVTVTAIAPKKAPHGGSNPKK